MSAGGRAVGVETGRADARAEPKWIPSAGSRLSLSPYGALVWGAHLLGNGNGSVRVELSERTGS